MRVGRYLDSIFAFCLRAALATLPPSIWLNCASLTLSNSARAFSSSASFWPRLGFERPARGMLLDDLCLPIMWTTSKQGTLREEARPLGSEVPGFSLSNAQRPNDRRTRRGTRRSCRRPCDINAAHQNRFRPKEPGYRRWLSRSAAVFSPNHAAEKCDLLPNFSPDASSGICVKSSIHAEAVASESLH
jgi:hypothetical protein